MIIRVNRRTLAKQLAATAAAAILPRAVLAQSEADQRSYDSATISVRLVGEGSNTAVLLTEHGDADYAIVEAFYQVPFQNKLATLSKEATTALAKEMTAAADLPLAVADILFVRIKELKVLGQAEFGR